MTVETIVLARRNVLQAVIDEARKRARRRRLRSLLVVLVSVACAAVAYVSRNGAPTPSTASAQPIRVDKSAIGPLPKNGRLTLMSIETNANQDGPSGWYAVSSLDPSGRLRTLVRCPHRAGWCGEVESIDWSPRGARLALSVTSLAVNNPYNGLHVVDLRTGGDSQLVHQGKDGEYDWFDVDWAPDGRRLAYAANGHIAVLNTDGSGRRILETGTVGHDHSPSWSPDGRWIAFATRSNDGSAVYVIRVDGFGRRLLVRDGAAPAWSPDGSRIAFRGRAGIRFVTPNGRLLAPRRGVRAGVPVGIDGPPVWSPDGKKIAMSTRHQGTWVMNADGTGLLRLTRYSSVGLGVSQRPRPAWRPRP